MASTVVTAHPSRSPSCRLPHSPSPRQWPHRPGLPGATSPVPAACTSLSLGPASGEEHCRERGVGQRLTFPPLAMGLLAQLGRSRALCVSTPRQLLCNLAEQGTHAYGKKSNRQPKGSMRGQAGLASHAPSKTSKPHRTLSRQLSLWASRRSALPSTRARVVI